MTLIVSAVTPDYCAVVSDRLVTIRGRTEPHDRAANKTVLQFATDAVSIYSYSGEAYIGGTTTDQRLVEYMLGEQVEPPLPNVGFGIAKYGHEFLCPVDIALHRIQKGLNQDKLILPKELCVTVCGLRTKNTSSMRPFRSLILGPNWPESTIRARYADVDVEAVPVGYVNERSLVQLAKSLAKVHRKHRTSMIRARRETLHRLTKLVRDTEHRLKQKTIGRDCLSVFVNFGSAENSSDDAFVTVEFLPNDDAAAYGYTPWILHPAGRVGPIRLIGEYTEKVYCPWANPPERPVRWIGARPVPGEPTPDGRVGILFEMEDHERKDPPG